MYVQYSITAKMFQWKCFAIYQLKVIYLYLQYFWSVGCDFPLFFYCTFSLGSSFRAFQLNYLCLKKKVPYSLQNFLRTSPRGTNSYDWYITWFFTLDTSNINNFPCIHISLPANSLTHFCQIAFPVWLTSKLNSLLQKSKITKQWIWFSSN